MAVKQINAHTAKEWLDNQEAILVDVRELSEHSSQKIDGAMLHPVDTITCENLPRTDKKIIIHCQKGMRGINACKKLLLEDEDMNVYNMEGGIEAWQQAGFEVIDGVIS